MLSRFLGQKGWPYDYVTYKAEFVKASFTRLQHVWTVFGLAIYRIFIECTLLMDQLNFRCWKVVTLLRGYFRKKAQLKLCCVVVIAAWNAC